MMLEPVSVIIPTYNRGELLVRAIDSVLGQDYPDFELIVVDDGSDDGSQDLLNSYGDSLVCLYQENRGASAARNSGIRAARYDLLAFLDSDDHFALNKLRQQAAVMANHPEYLVSHTDEIWYRNGELLNQKDKHARTGGDLFARSLKMCVVGMSTVMARRPFFEKVGFFDEELPCCEDYALWLQAASSLEFLHVPFPLTIKHGGREDQLSMIHRVGIDRYRIKAILKLLDEDNLTRQQKLLAREELVVKCRIYGQGCRKHGRVKEGAEYLSLAETCQRKIESGDI